MLVSFLGSSVTRLMYLLDGAIGSVFFILLYHHVAFQSFCILFFSLSPYTCIIADLLCSSHFFRSFSSLSKLLLPSVAAFFACLSVFSFPSILLCPGTHLTFIFIPLCLSCSTVSDAILDGIKYIVTWIGFC
jgi:hypothetical protein